MSISLQMHAKFILFQMDFQFISIHSVSFQFNLLQFIAFHFKFISISIHFYFFIKLISVHFIFIFNSVQIDLILFYSNYLIKLDVTLVLIVSLSVRLVSWLSAGMERLCLPGSSQHAHALCRVVGLWHRWIPCGYVCFIYPFFCDLFTCHECIWH